MKILLYTSLLFIKLALFPDAQLLVWMAIAIAVDFATGIAKAIVLRQPRTSTGYRKTITKFLQYGGGIAITVILSHAAQQYRQEGLQSIVDLLNNGLLVFIIYIEVTSICENILACDSTNKFARLVINPLHRLLTVQILNNPISQAAERLEEKENPS